VAVHFFLIISIFVFPARNKTHSLLVWVFMIYVRVCYRILSCKPYMLIACKLKKTKYL